MPGCSKTPLGWTAAGPISAWVTHRDVTLYTEGKLTSLPYFVPEPARFPTKEQAVSRVFQVPILPDNSYTSYVQPSVQGFIQPSAVSYSQTTPTYSSNVISSTQVLEAIPPREKTVSIQVPEGVNLQSIPSTTAEQLGAQVYKIVPATGGEKRKREKESEFISADDLDLIDCLEFEEIETKPEFKQEMDTPCTVHYERGMTSDFQPPKRQQLVGRCHVSNQRKSDPWKTFWCQPSTKDVFFQNYRGEVCKNGIGTRERDENGDAIIEEDEVPGKDSISLRCVVVTLVGPTGKREVVNALLDDGSDRTLIDSKLAGRLMLETKSITQLVMEGVKGRKTKEFSELVELTVESCYETQAFRIMAATADNPVGSLRPFNWNRLAKYWGHLRHLKVMPFAEAPCEMIIGSDYPQLMTSLKEFRHSDELKAAPVARLTPLGLTIAGPLLPATEHRDVRIAEKYEAERRRFASGSVQEEVIRSDEESKARVLKMTSETIDLKTSADIALEGKKVACAGFSLLETGWKIWQATLWQAAFCLQEAELVVSKSKQAEFEYLSIILKSTF